LGVSNQLRCPAELRDTSDDESSHLVGASLRGCVASILSPDGQYERLEWDSGTAAYRVLGTAIQARRSVPGEAGSYFTSIDEASEDDLGAQILVLTLGCNRKSLIMVFRMRTTGLDGSFFSAIVVCIMPFSAPHGATAGLLAGSATRCRR
jgi:hypothetical protein